MSEAMGIDGISGRPKVALIAGPTASGKSGLALSLAQHIDGTIVNADSAQVYRDLRLLSARPSEAEEAAAPHRLFGHIDGAEACSAARWAADAKAAIAEAEADGRVPILVGGTGLYIRTLLEGIAPIPGIDPAIRAAIRAMPVEQACAALREEDPASASRLAPTDTARIARALEVVRSTGRTIAEWRREKQGGIGAAIDLHPLILLPDRGWLHDRSDRRFADMLAQGAAGEVEALLARGLGPDLPVMRAIGVREIAGWLAGDHGRDEAIARGRLATRRYAKRQYTWFRRQPPADWMRVDESEYDAALGKLAISLLGRPG